MVSIEYLLRMSEGGSHVAYRTAEVASIDETLARCALALDPRQGP